MYDPDAEIGKDIEASRAFPNKCRHQKAVDASSRQLEDDIALVLAQAGFTNGRTTSEFERRFDEHFGPR